MRRDGQPDPDLRPAVPMTESANLWLYFLLISGVIILPGMDMAFVMGCRITGGWRSGVAAVTGIVAGGACHVLIAVTGISALLMLVPAALLAMLLAGAAYIGRIGWSMLRACSGATLAAVKGANTPLEAFFGAMVTSLLNPKAYIFMLAIFPQFMHVSQGSLWAQASVLGLITAGTQIAVYGAVVAVTGQARARLATRPASAVWMTRGVGLMLITVAVLTLCSGIMNLQLHTGTAGGTGTAIH